jgi:hypothetical protein
LASWLPQQPELRGIGLILRVAPNAWAGDPQNRPDWLGVCGATEAGTCSWALKMDLFDFEVYLRANSLRETWIARESDSLKDAEIVRVFSPRHWHMRGDCVSYDAEVVRATPKLPVAMDSCGPASEFSSRGQSLGTIGTWGGPGPARRELDEPNAGIRVIVRDQETMVRCRRASHHITHWLGFPVVRSAVFEADGQALTLRRLHRKNAPWVIVREYEKRWLSLAAERSDK